MVTAFDRCQRTTKVYRPETTVKKNRTLALRIGRRRSSAFRVPVERRQERACIVRQNIRPSLATGRRSRSPKCPSVYQTRLSIVSGRSPPSTGLPLADRIRVCVGYRARCSADMSLMGKQNSRAIIWRTGSHQLSIPPIARLARHSGSFVEVRQAPGQPQSAVPEQHLQPTGESREDPGDQRVLCYANDGETSTVRIRLPFAGTPCKRRIRPQRASFGDFQLIDKSPAVEYIFGVACARSVAD